MTEPNHGHSPAPVDPNDPCPPGTGFFEKTKNINAIFYGLLAVCIALVLADFTYHKHAHFGFEEVTGFHAGFGFLAYVGLVLSATQLRKLLKREENYYE